MMKQEKKFYKERTIGLLTNFQMLELAIKLYIGASYDYINSLVEERIYFSFSIVDVENYPLERLLNTFGKLNGNENLKKRLNKLRKERNYIAHEALLVTVGSNSNMEILHKKAEDFFYLEDELSECLKLVTEEFRQLKVQFSKK